MLVADGGIGVNSLAVFGNSLFGGSTGSNAYMNFGATSGYNGYGIATTQGQWSSRTTETRAAPKMAGILFRNSYSTFAAAARAEEVVDAPEPLWCSR